MDSRYFPLLTLIQHPVRMLRFHLGADQSIQNVYHGNMEDHEREWIRTCVLATPHSSNDKHRRLAQSDGVVSLSSFSITPIALHNHRSHGT